MQRIGFKRNEHIKNLSREHHFNLLFCWKIRQGLHKEVAINRICKYVQYFWQNLQLHFREEEKIFFAPMKDRMVQRAINEHKHIKKQIINLENNAGNNARKLLVELADLVYDHVQYEERELFPHLEKTLSKEQMENISNQIQKHNPSTLLDYYEDQFWNIK